MHSDAAGTRGYVIVFKLLLTFLRPLVERRCAVYQCQTEQTVLQVGTIMTQISNCLRTAYVEGVADDLHLNRGGAKKTGTGLMSNCGQRWQL